MEFDLDSYIEKICSKAEVDPDEKLGEILDLSQIVADILNRNIDPSKYPILKNTLACDNRFCFITFRELIRIVIVQNWNPFNDAGQFTAFEFIKLLKNFSVESGLPSEPSLNKYVHYIKKYYGIPHFVSNMSYAEYLLLEIESLLSSTTNSVIVRGEPGINSDAIVETIINLIDHSPITPELIEFIISDKRIISNYIIRSIITKAISCPTDIKDMVFREAFIDSFKVLSFFQRLIPKWLFKNNLGRFSKNVDYFARSAIKRNPKCRSIINDYLIHTITKENIERPRGLRENLRHFLAVRLKLPTLTRKEITCSEVQDNELIRELINNITSPISYSNNTIFSFLLDCQTEDISIYVKDINKAGETFRKMIKTLINERELSGLEDKERLNNIRLIICKDSSPLINKSTSTDKARMDDLGWFNSRTVVLYPFRFLRIDIPLLTYLHYNYLQLRLSNQEDPEKNNICNKSIIFPWVLIKFWYSIESWPGNYKQFETHICNYISKFMRLSKTDLLEYIDNPDLKKAALESDRDDDGKDIPTKIALEENKKTFFKLLRLVQNPNFDVFIATQDLAPYDIITIDELLSKPYLYYALRQFDKEKNEWDFDPETIKKLMTLSSSTALTEPRDFCHELFGEVSAKSLDDKTGSTGPICDQLPENKRKDKRPAISPKIKKAIKPLILPEGTSWKDLSVKWSYDSCVFDSLKSSYPPWQEVRTCKEMGFESLRPEGRPIKEWESILRKLAENKGRINVEKHDLFLPQSIDKANKRLALFFKTKENLIVLDEIDKKYPFYYSKFKIQKRTL